MELEYTPQTKLTREQKEAVGLLSIGTFLEYFDLMLYVHMAVLLNQVFFPKTDAFTGSLLTAFAFCSTYVLRPVGALVFGWIGDNIGRKAVVIITTTLMACSCVGMFLLPTYAQIGIAASWLVTICRIVQGMSSMGEIIGASLYLTEITKPPIQYMIVSSLGISVSLGTLFALTIAFIFTSFDLNWRYAFLMGLTIALIGTAGRTALKETPEFVDAKKKLKNIHNGFKINPAEIEKCFNLPLVKEKVDIKIGLSLFCLEIGCPISMYLSYFYCSDILKNTFYYTPEQIIHQNLIVSIFQLASMVIITLLSYYINSLFIVKTRLIFFTLLTIFFPFLLRNISLPIHVLMIQVYIIFFTISPVPAFPVIVKYIPVFKRFTCASLMFALSRAIVFLPTSFGLVYLTKYFKEYGVLLAIIPILIPFYWGLTRFERLEIKNGKYRLFLHS